MSGEAGRRGQPGWGNGVAEKGQYGKKVFRGWPVCMEGLEENSRRVSMDPRWRAWRASLREELSRGRQTCGSQR